MSLKKRLDDVQLKPLQEWYVCGISKEALVLELLYDHDFKIAKNRLNSEYYLTTLITEPIHPSLYSSITLDLSMSVPSFETFLTVLQTIRGNMIPMCDENELDRIETILDMESISTFLHSGRREATVLIGPFERVMDVHRCIRHRINVSVTVRPTRTPKP
jgi:hypothetical protein